MELDIAGAEPIWVAPANVGLPLARDHLLPIARQRLSVR
jgi:hypothetical protein